MRVHEEPAGKVRLPDTRVALIGPAIEREERLVPICSHWVAPTKSRCPAWNAASVRLPAAGVSL